MKNVVGICNLHDGPHLGTLTERRPLGTVSFLGRYGLMDFALSNISNSGIDRIAILVENNIQAVRAHMGSGSIWVNNTVTGFVRYFSDESVTNKPVFNTDINNILSNRHLFEELNADYFVMMPPFFLMSIDFNEVVANHIASGKDVTIVYTHAKRADKDYVNCEEITFDENGNFSNINTVDAKTKAADISLQTYVFSREAFIRILTQGKQISAIYNIRQVLSKLANSKLLSINPYKFEGYVVPILSLDSYINYSFELLDYGHRCKIFNDDWPIYTTTHNTPPSLFGSNAKVQNSFVANGSIIKGKVINSIISRDVIVEEGAVVENCILFTDTYVGEDVKLKYVLADKSAHFVEKKKVVGAEDDMICIDAGVNI